MKKILLILCLFIFGMTFTSCTISQDKDLEKVSVIMPTGTPALGLAEAANDLIKNGNTVEITAGADLLVAAFTQANYDIIVAPVNLGSKFYNTNQKYGLFKTFVWGNLYLASKKEISSLNELDGKEVVVFGKNSTPDIVFRTLINNIEGLNVNLKYVSDVSEANALLVSNQADYVISAEPALSKLKMNLNLSVIDLQKEWQKLTGFSSYPQAGIFVKIDKYNDVNIKAALTKLHNSVNSAILNPEKAASEAVQLHNSFKTLGVEVLTKAIPNCNYFILDNEIKEVAYYLQTMIDLGFSAQVGGKLPDAAFYLS